MVSSKTVFIVALIAFCCFSFGHSLRCYVCNSRESCINPSQYECNQQLANSSRLYLDSFYMGVNFNISSYNYNCFSDFLNFTSGSYYYKSCTYDNVRTCDLQLRTELTYQTHSRSCYQCNNYDGCNPAGFVNVNALTVIATVAVVAIARGLWH